MTLSELVRLALAEDIGPGDLTTQACVPSAATGRARIVAKEPVIVAGQDAARETFRQAGATYTPTLSDSAAAEVGDVIGEVHGPLRSILTGERVALNFLMKLSGIATHVRPYVTAANGQIRVVDTRKTTPLLRALEKAAVRAGGAWNHRCGLYDGVMIKENHIAAAGGLGLAVLRAREAVHHLVKVEVEIEALDQIREALAAGAEVLLLDNMNDATLAQATRIARGLRPDVLLEASGNMTPERISGLLEMGLDVVSAGGLIHQARWVDLSLRVDPCSQPPA